MGLAIVHGIVTSHGGVITVESLPGEGTTFSIYLPRIAAAPGEKAQAELSLSPGTGCILFVDDERMLAHLGQATLEQFGYTVVSHTSSIEALEAFRAMPQRFDLVITDQTMPQMTGEQLVRELRRIRPDIPIILCTGFSHIMNAEKAQAMGIDDFCMKPLVAQDLAVTVQQVLAQRAEPAPQPGAEFHLIDEDDSRCLMLQPRLPRLPRIAQEVEFFAERWTGKRERRSHKRWLMRRHHHTSAYVSVG